MKFDPTLYLVTDSTGRTDDDFLSILEKALTGGVTLVQLREKERGGGEYLRLARLTKAVCDRLSSTTARTSPWRQMRRAYT